MHNKLKIFFENRVAVEGYQVPDTHCSIHPKIPEADLYVSTMADTLPFSTNVLKGKDNVVYITRTFLKEKTSFLNHLPDQTTVLYFDYSDVLAVETLGILRSINKRLNYIYCTSKNELSKYDNVSAIIVIKDNNLLFDEKETNIGWYKISPETYIEISQRLNILDEKISEKVYKYSQSVHVVNSGILKMVKSKWDLEDVWKTVIDMIREGVALINEKGHVLQYNDYIKTQSVFIQQQDHLSVYPQIKDLLGEEDLVNEVIDIEESGRTFLISTRRLVTFGEEKGWLLLLRDAREISNAERNLRVQQRKRFFPAKYQFSDIITEDNEMKKNYTDV